MTDLGVRLREARRLASAELARRHRREYSRLVEAALLYLHENPGTTRLAKKVWAGLERGQQEAVRAAGQRK